MPISALDYFVLDQSTLDGYVANTASAVPIGTQTDMLSRIVALMPTGWYPDVAPIVQAVLSGGASMLASLYSLLGYTKSQTRITTATDFWLDIIASDFFGEYITRRPAESDTVFSARIRHNLFRLRGSRPAMVSAITALTGQLPVIIEPWNTGDTGAYAGVSSVEAGAALDALVLDQSRLDSYYAENLQYAGLAYNTTGAYGSANLPYQCFITVYRPIGQGIAYVSGYNSTGGGYGVGSLEYTNPSMVVGIITDAQLYAEVARTIPAGCIAWTKLLTGRSPLSPVLLVLDHSALDVSNIA